MTQTRLAELAGLSLPQLSRLEGGKQGCRSSVLFRIAKALGVKPISLLLDEEELAQPSVQQLEQFGTKRLLRALESPEFVWLAETLARTYLNDTKAFSAIRNLTNAIMGATSKARKRTS